MNISAASLKAFKLQGFRRGAGRALNSSFARFVGIFVIACVVVATTLDPRRLNSQPNNENQGASSGLLRNETPESDKTEEPRRIFVCITGQLSRLELGSKIENLFEPLSKAGIHMDVALVISNTSTQSKPGNEKIRNFFTSMDQVVEALSKFPGVTILNKDIHLQHEPVVNEIYKVHRGTVIKDPVELDRAVKNHIKQFEGMARCYEHMTDSGHSYEMVHRVREDHGYAVPVDYDKMYQLTQQKEKTILVSSCADHGGFNDRGGFASPKAAYSYFVHPLMFMYIKPIKDWITNTEKFLQDVYTHYSDNHVIVSNDFYFYRKRLTNEARNLIEDIEDVGCIKKMFGTSHPDRFEFVDTN